VLLLTGDRASPGADRGRDQKPRQHQGEELDAQVADAGAVVDDAAEADECLQRLRIALDELGEARVVTERRVDVHRGRCAWVNGGALGL
jgi:hypothetical protein